MVYGHAELTMKSTLILFFAFCIALIVLMGTSSPAHAESTIKPSKEWTGQLEDGGLEKLKPTDGLLTTKDEFAKLWAAWMGKKQLPEIDFDKELIIVASSSAVRVFGIHIIDKNGDATPTARFEMDKGSKGFTFAIAVFKREGIKTINGKLIKK